MSDIIVAALAAASTITTALLAYINRSAAQAYKLQEAKDRQKLAAAAQLEEQNARREQDIRRQQDQMTQFYAQILSEHDVLRKDNIELRARIEELQQEISRLRDKLEYYEGNLLAKEARQLVSALLNKGCHHPAWIHDLSAGKWYLNDAYCREFQVSRPSFWSPVNIFGRYDADDAIRYTANDFKIADAGGTHRFKERVRSRIMDPDCDEFFEAEFEKTAMVIGDRPFVFGRMVRQSGGSEEKQNCLNG
jgi:polyhydroxyalkanoate synthesis regulator phasin